MISMHSPESSNIPQWLLLGSISDMSEGEGGGNDSGFFALGKENDSGLFALKVALTISVWRAFRVPRVAGPKKLAPPKRNNLIDELLEKSVSPRNRAFVKSAHSNRAPMNSAFENFARLKSARFLNCESPKNVKYLKSE